MKNDAIKALTYPGIDLNELIELQASKQTGSVPPTTQMGFGKARNGEKPRVYQKSRHGITRKNTPGGESK